ncbi:MAG: DUF4384 domain-containing protein [Paraburkholderia tropica]
MSPRDNRTFIDGAYSESTPVVEPVRSVTSFSPALSCMDQMLETSAQPPIFITSKIFADPSGRAGTAVKELIITALQQMSLRSKTFPVVDYEVSIAQQDTVQNLSGLLLGMNAMNIKPPEVYVSGAVSYIDDNVAARRRSLGVSSDGSIHGREVSADLAFNGDINTSVVALELHLGDFRTRTLIPGIFAANSAILAKGGAGLEGGGTIFKTGVQFSLARDYSQGSGLALRSLVDIGMIELVGKWLGLPYWRCLSLNQSAPEFQRELRTWYEKASQPSLTRFAQTVLKRNAYFDGVVDSQSSPELKSSIALYQTDRQIPPSGLINFPTYEKMIGEFTETDVFGMTRRTGPEDAAEAVSAATATSLREGGKGPIRVDIKIADGVYPQPGGILNIAARLDRSAAMRCFYQDSGGSVTQIFPNPFQRVGEVFSNQTISIPDDSSHFTLRFDRPGHEAIDCYAANPGTFERLPAALQSEGLVPLPGVAHLADIRNALLALNAPSLSMGGIAFDISRNPYPPLIPLAQSK